MSATIGGRQTGTRAPDRPAVAGDGGHARGMRAKDAMTSPAITVTPATPCRDAAALLVRHRISSLPVVDASGHLVGLVSEVDLLPLGTSPDLRSQSTPLPRTVADVMMPEVYAVVEEMDLSVVAQLMREANMKRFPVLHGDRVVGVVSRHDVLNVIVRPDSEAKSGIKVALIEQGMRLTRMDIQVRDGVVYLTGDDDRMALRLAEIVARSVPGVLDVRLTVLQA